MFKRFMIGFALGIGLMYYYLNYGEEVAQDAVHWAEKPVSEYRGDQRQHQAEGVLGNR